MRHSKKSFVGVVAAIAAVAAVGGVGALDSSSDPSAGENVLTRAQVPSADATPAFGNATFRVGPPEVVIAPKENRLVDPVTGRKIPMIDGFLNGIKLPDGTVRAYISNQHSVLLQGSSAADLKVVRNRQGTPHLALRPGSTEQPRTPDFDPDSVYDKCGAWMSGVALADPKPPYALHGFYHSEHHCRYPATDQTRMAEGYAKSYDGGKTFVRTPRSGDPAWPASKAWPNNVIHSSEFGEVEGEATGLSRQSVIERDGYYYMYYGHFLPDCRGANPCDPDEVGRVNRTNVDRAPTASGGLPGTWSHYSAASTPQHRWETGRLDVPATHLRYQTLTPAGTIETRSNGEPVLRDLTAASASRDRSGAVLLVNQATGTGGITMYSAEDGLSFTRLPMPLVPYGEDDVRDDWGIVDSGATGGDIYGYPSIVGRDASRTWDREFYLFYLYVPRGAPKEQGYLIRRKVTVTQSAGQPPRGLIALTDHTSTSTGERWASTALLPSTHRRGALIGHLLTSPIPAPDGTDVPVALYDCVSKGGDHFPAQNCDSNVRQVRLLGYVWRAPGTGRLPLYRCVAGKGARQDRFASTRKDCGGRGASVRVSGYVAP